MKKEKAFTLIELSVVMAIIAVLAVLLIGAIRAAVAARARSQHLGNARAIETALEAFAGRYGGSYCGVAGSPIAACGFANASISTVGAALTPNFLSQNVQDAGCDAASGFQGGARFNGYTSSSFTLQVTDQNCNAAGIFETITH